MDEISLRIMTRELCHRLYSGWENDPSIYSDMKSFAPYRYDKYAVNDYFDKKQSPSRILFAIMNSGEPIGGLQLKHINAASRECTLSIHLQNDSVKGKGYGTHAERLAIRYAFDVLGMVAVNADTIEKNTRSGHVLEKVGFRFIRQENGFRYYRYDRPLQDKGYPTREIAEELLREAETHNVGPWGDHSRNVAFCAEKIAEACALDGEKAYVLGLLHDIGRRFGTRHLGHVYDGYKYMLGSGYAQAARICLTHSFCIQDLSSYIGRFDISDDEQFELGAALAAVVYDDYDRLIQLCDALGAADGIVDIEERMRDVKNRYGSYPQDKWDKNIELKEYFEKLSNRNIYDIVGK